MSHEICGYLLLITLLSGELGILLVVVIDLCYTTEHYSTTINLANQFKNKLSTVSLL